MASEPTERPLTGRMVFAITAFAFAIIIAVNVTLAVKAVTTFPGLEVRSSYVASQSFDADRNAQEALGWTFAHDYHAGVLSLTFTGRDGRPANVASVTALVGRPAEAADDVAPAFVSAGGGYRAEVDLDAGKWMVQVDAVAEDGTKFHKRFDIMVKG